MTQLLLRRECYLLLNACPMESHHGDVVKAALFCAGLFSSIPFVGPRGYHTSDQHWSLYRYRQDVLSVFGLDCVRLLEEGLVVVLLPVEVFAAYQVSHHGSQFVEAASDLVQFVGEYVVQEVPLRSGPFRHGGDGHFFGSLDSGVLDHQFLSVEGTGMCELGDLVEVHVDGQLQVVFVAQHIDAFEFINASPRLEINESGDLPVLQLWVIGRLHLPLEFAIAGDAQRLEPPDAFHQVIHRKPIETINLVQFEVVPTSVSIPAIGYLQ